MNHISTEDYNALISVNKCVIVSVRPCVGVDVCVPVCPSLYETERRLLTDLARSVFV